MYIAVLSCPPVPHSDSPFCLTNQFLLMSEQPSAGGEPVTSWVRSASAAINGVATLSADVATLPLAISTESVVKGADLLSKLRQAMGAPEWDLLKFTSEQDQQVLDNMSLLRKYFGDAVVVRARLTNALKEMLMTKAQRTLRR